MGQACCIGLAAHQIERQQVTSGLRAGEARQARGGRKAGFQRIQRGEFKIAVAPLQHADGFEIVVFEPIHGFLIERIGFTGYAESAVIHVASGAACHLAHFGRG